MNKCLVLILVAVTSLSAYQEPSSERTFRTTCVIPRGKVVKMVQPIYPPDAAAHGVGGRVTLMVSVAKDGEPTKIRMVKGDPIFGEAAITAVKQWRWEPFVVKGEAIPLEVSVTINFEPRRKKPVS